MGIERTIFPQMSRKLLPGASQGIVRKAETETETQRASTSLPIVTRLSPPMFILFIDVSTFQRFSMTIDYDRTLFYSILLCPFLSSFLLFFPAPFFFL